MCKKKFYLVVVAIIMTVSLFISCEGYVEYIGITYDAQTKEPLDSVKCALVDYKRSNLITYSDSVGNYHVSTPLVGCVPNCREYEVEFSKYGYKTQIIKAPSDVYLEKE